MSKEPDALRMWSLWATHPKHLDCIAELYATTAEAGVRADQLRESGYSVEIILSNMASSSGPIVEASTRQAQRPANECTAP